MRLSLLAVPALMVISACTPRADAIAPTPMGNAFQSTSCAEAQRELMDERQRLAALEQRQNSAATNDAIAVAFVGLPLANAFGGNKEGAVATSKGKVIALENRLRSC